MGTLKKTSGGGSSDIGATVGNTGGTIDVTSGTLNLGGGLDNFSSTGGVGKVTGGTYMIRTNSVLKFIGADIDVNAATIVLDGLGSAILDQNNSDAIDNLSDNDGSFTIRSDRDLRTDGALRNDGSVTIGTGSVLTTTGEYVQAPGSTVLEDTTSKLTASGARVRVQDGVMKGLGTIEPALEATGGRVQPGLSSGILKVAGNYAQGSTGTLEVEIGGAAPGSGHDQLDVGTTASLGGTLDIVTPSSFTPTGGESFTILKCGAVACRSGQFENVQGTNVGPGKEYQVRYNATDVTLELNNPPEATGDTVETDEDTPLNDIDVLSNDEDVDGDSLSVSSVTQPPHGSAELDNGKVNYTPAPNYNGSDSFSYTVSDGNGGTDTAVVSITVKAVNDAPVAQDDTAETDEDTSALMDVLVNDEDLDDGDTLSVSSFTQPSHGQVSLDSGKLRYEPAPNYNGPDSFTYKAKDSSNAESNEPKVDITVKAVNDAPVAKEDSYSTDEDNTLNIDAPGVLANDEDVDNAAAELKAVQVSGPAHGTLTLNNDGSFSYTPDPNFFGDDSFTYKANDVTDDSNTVTVSIKVNSVNDTPVAKEDSYSTDEDNTLSVDAPGVLENDTDVDNANLTAAQISGPAHGTLTLNNDGSFEYKPEANSSGPDSFTYKASDGQADSDVVTVSITVNAMNDAPVAEDDSAETAEDTPVDINVLSNDTDVDNTNAELRIASFTQPANGKLSDNGDGTLKYEPALNYNGSDSFTYKAKDPDNAESNVATVSITVNAVNDAPVANPDTKSTDEDTALIFPSSDLVSNDDEGAHDESAQTLTVTEVFDGAHGTVSLGTDGKITFTPEANFNGEATFTYRVCDNGSPSECSVETATVNVTVNAVNDEPVAENDTATTDEDTATDIAVLANDTDVDNASLTAVKVSDPAHGSVTLNNDGSFTYEPAPNYKGSDSFTYNASDGTADSNVATVNITVTAVNDAPVADDQSVTINEDIPKDITLGASDIDEGDTLSYSVVASPEHGTLSGTGANLAYTPEADYNGPDSFTFKANDGHLDSNVARVSITVTAVNDAPVAVDDTAMTPEDTPVEILAADLFQNDSTGPANESGQTLRISAVSGATNGQAELNEAGNVLFIPTPNFNGLASFDYTVCDNGTPEKCYEATAMVLVTVSAVNDRPVADDQSVTTNEDTAKAITLGASDVENDTLSYSVVDGPAHGTLSGTGANLTYTPADNYHGPDSFTFKANDVHLDSNVATVDITVTAVNDAPVAQGDSYDTNQDTALNIAVPGVLGNDTDADNANLTAVQVSGPSHGTLNLNANGSFTYTPNADYNGPDSFTYKANDGTADSNTVTVSITVKPVVDAWTFKGFYQPVDMNGVYNTVKGGLTVPLKFELFEGSTELTDTANIKQPLQATKITCMSGATEDTIELLTTGGTSLRYDSTNGQFIYDWKTPKTAGSCYKVTVTAQDGSTISAYFKLK